MFYKWLAQEKQEFTPIGNLVHTFKGKETLELYHISLQDKTLNKHHHRSLQALFQFFIESANFIEDDPDWQYFFLYRKTTEYRLVSFSTVFEERAKFFDSKKNMLEVDLPYRSRISQFLVLPDY